MYLDASGLTTFWNKCKNKFWFASNVDDIPTEDSSNLVKSGGVYQVTINKATKKTLNTVSGTSDVSMGISPNVFYDFGIRNNIYISSLIPPEGNELGEYSFQFESPTGSATNLKMPSNIRWIGDNEVEENAVYQISIVNNIAIMGVSYNS